MSRDLKKAHPIRRGIKDMFSLCAAKTNASLDADKVITSHRFYRYDTYNVRGRNYVVPGCTEFQMVARRIAGDNYKLFIEKLQIANSDAVREKLIPVQSECKGTYTFRQAVDAIKDYENKAREQYNLTDRQPRFAQHHSQNPNALAI